MKVLVACEESQAVTIAFRERGHEAFSCDLQLPSGGFPEWHIQSESDLHLKDIIYKGNWDLMIGHPPCTYLSGAGLHWCNIEKHGAAAKERILKRREAELFFLMMLNAPIGKICLENPLGWINRTIKPTQTIEPFYFGDRERKRTCLWLKNLPKLVHIKTDDLFEMATHTQVPQPTSIDSTGKKRYFTDAKNRRSIDRSKTFPGIAKAMAAQWSDIFQIIPLILLQIILK